MDGTRREVALPSVTGGSMVTLYAWDADGCWYGFDRGEWVWAPMYANGEAPEEIAGAVDVSAFDGGRVEYDQLRRAVEAYEAYLEALR